MRCEVRYWRNDQVKSQITVEADTLDEALGMHLSNPDWVDARDWPIEHGTDGELFAANPDDPTCMIEAVKLPAYRVECNRNDGLGWVQDGCWGGEYAIDMTEQEAKDSVDHLRNLYPDCEWRCVVDD